MELENIQKRNLGNAKQEDKKTALALIKTLSLMDDKDELDSSDESTRVKQEEMKNGNSLLKQNGRTTIIMFMNKHTNTHTHIYIYIYIYIAQLNHPKENITTSVLYAMRKWRI